MNRPTTQKMEACKGGEEGMMDRERVIRALEYLISKDCTDNQFDYADEIETAIALLKAQEAVKPIYDEEKYGDHLPHCGNCEKVLPNDAVYGKVNFCHYCGRPVKRE